ncbi:dihydrofolate reductase [uncultured Anaerococcus sp.]|uniref:dihydrofolate reductase n=1 Tax=uncultured Anaerococcus sp. TaxID=293428 RepID=UPI00261CFC12|nr:dihydrofolate reductase [uncultured Anaerococcus sp.]
MSKTLTIGRKTHDFIGQALPGRENIVLSRGESLELSGALVFHNLDDILDYTMDIKDDVFVTGRSEIANIFLEVVDTAIITKIFESRESDTFIYNFDEDPDFNIADKSNIYEDNGIKF